MIYDVYLQIKTAKFAPVWTTILKIWAIFVHQTLTEHTLMQGGEYGYKVVHWKVMRQLKKKVRTGLKM